MIKYNIQVNNGVEAFAREGKTITANEVVEAVDAAQRDCGARQSGTQRQRRKR